MVLDKTLPDSLQYLNEHINAAFQDRLYLINLKLQVGRSRYRSCPAVALSLMNSLRFIIHQPIERLLEEDQRIALYPPRHIEASQYFERSIHRGSYYRLFTPLGRTLNANGIYFGMDKLGHFVAFGARYYSRYIKLRARGIPEEQALQEMAVKGIRSEVLYVGKWISGVLSFADLEANFQGALLLKDLCEQRGAPESACSSSSSAASSSSSAAYPCLQFRKGKWHFRRAIDLRHYINPDWDESYNESAYHPLRWPTVRAMIGQYCPLLEHRIRRERLRYYRRIHRPSLNSLLLRDLWKSRELADPTPYRLASYCAEQS